MISTKSKKEWYVTNTNVRIKKGYIAIIKLIGYLIVKEKFERMEE